VIERQPALAEGAFVPDIPFTTADGKQTTLFAVRQPIAIVGFVEASLESCCHVDPTLAGLSEQFHTLPVTVVQVVMAQGTDRLDPDERKTPDLRRSDPVVLYDQNRIAWTGYGRPKPGTLVLIDKCGTVVEVSDMQNRRTLARTATKLAAAEVDDHLD
jgi:hypothetical protein